MADKMSGKVKWFDSKKGYGFISPANGGKDIFLHYSALSGEGYKTIKEGTSVEFFVTDGQRGPQACDVVEIPAK